MATWTNWRRIGLRQGRHAIALASSVNGPGRLKVEWEGPGVPLQAIRTAAFSFVHHQEGDAILGRVADRTLIEGENCHENF
jgi:hypothetical protein